MKKLNLPISPAPRTTLRISPNAEMLLNAAFCRALLGILLLRNGGKTMTFTQEDFDKITGLHVIEGVDNGTFIIALGYPEGRQE